MERLIDDSYNFSLGTECEDDGVSFDRFHPSYKADVEDIFLQFLRKAYRKSSVHPSYEDMKTYRVVSTRSASKIHPQEEHRLHLYFLCIGGDSESQLFSRTPCRFNSHQWLFYHQSNL